MKQMERPGQLKFPFLDYENDLALRAFVLTPIRQRILDYNEDDCRATRVLLDGVRSLAA